MIPKYVIRKLIFYFSSFWFILFIDFLIPHLMPGNPVDAIIGTLEQTTALTPRQILSIKESIGYTNGPIIVQFYQFVVNVLSGHFGRSIEYYPTPVIDVIKQSIFWTILLYGLALVLSFLLGNHLGLKAAHKRRSLGDSANSFISLFFYSFPYFWMAIVLLFFFSIEFHIFPESGAYNNLLSPSSLSYYLSVVTHIILPLATLILSSYAAWYLGMRNNTIATLNEDYLKYAEMIGLRKSTIINYSKKNAMLPNLTAFAFSLGNIISGGILVEMVFAYPGLGFDIYNAVVNEDFPVIETSFFLIVISVLIANFVMDLLYYKLDPRISEG